MLEEFQTEMTQDGGVVYGEGYNDEEEVVPILQDEVPTQLQFPLKAVLRTIVAYLVGLGLAWVARQVPSVQSTLAELTQPLVEAITNGVAVALAATLADKVDRSDWVTLVPGAAWRRPDGVIEQRMKVQESPNVSTRRLWPVAFPSECYGAWITPADLGSSSQITAQADVTGVIFREGAAFGDSSSYFYVFGIGR